MTDLENALNDTNEAPAAKGHNLSKDRLRSCIERIERVKSEIKDLNSDAKDIFTELKSAGYNPKVIRMLLKIRGMDADEFDNEMAELELYRDAMEGMRK